jgi:hypothetical protein
MTNKPTNVSAACAAAALLAFAADAGTVTAEKVYADEVLTREIGLRPPPDGMLFYPFDEDEMGTVSDASGNGNDGAASGCVWTNAGHRSAGAMSFDGVDDSVNAGSVSNFPALDRYSVSLWFLHNGGGSFTPGYGQKMLDKTSWYHDWRLYLYPDDGGVGLYIYEGGVGAGMGGRTGGYMDNTWHHVAVVRDGPDGQFWVDGDLHGTCTNMFSVYSTSDVCVGYSFSGDYYQRKSWSGLLDQVRIFGRAISAAEVASLYAEGAPSAAVSVTTNLAVNGGLSVTGDVSFASGVLYSRPRGDLSCGIYTNAP